MSGTGSAVFNNKSYFFATYIYPDKKGKKAMNINENPVKQNSIFSTGKFRTTTVSNAEGFYQFAASTNRTTTNYKVL